MTGEITLKTKGESMTVDLPADWVNYGDVNPQRHGGLFATFEDDTVTVIETIAPRQLPDGMSEEEHLVHTHSQYYDGVIHHDAEVSYPVNILKRELEAQHDTDGLIQAATDGRLPIALVMSVTRTHAHRDRWVHDSQYSESLHTKYGVDKEVLPGYE